ncbi:hypothetical protein M422DRAFT_780625 [Sphaerobolus stellatus SS14]|uniref:Ubiquitin-like protease family profile domain-containing protein n=1 Tax=Sphaerobolus stellatus (strain SS14) TaxID=990650 RepID=A0A0C9V113_SPHS4|nr:hypothetical protein M422DRAFT_780625 [Sphaerobolus stellatus SS14]
MSNRPIAGSHRSSKARKKVNANLTSTSTPNFSLKPSKDVKPDRQARDAPHLPSTSCKGTIVTMPFDKSFVQSRNLPLQAGMGLGRLENLTLWICTCKSVAEQLMHRGPIGCAPLQPSMAFEMNLLELVSVMMLHIAPNISGWSLSLEWFYKQRGYTLGPRDYLKCRFNATYQWFNVLKDTNHAQVDKVIWGGKDSMNPLTALISDSAHCIVALDANFMQKCQKEHYEDVTFQHPQSHFMSEKDIHAICTYIENLCKTPGTRSESKLFQRLPEDVLNGCQDRFVAADESQVKASTAVFVDMGLVALYSMHMGISGHASFFTIRERFPDSVLAMVKVVRDSGALSNALFLPYGYLEHRWMLDRQIHHNKQDSLHNLASWLNRKEKACTLCKEWKAQVEDQMTPLRRQSKKSADHEIQQILELRGLNAEDETVTMEEIQAKKEAYEALKKRLLSKVTELGITARQKLNTLKGNLFLRNLTNANALKTHIRAKLVLQEFKCGHLEHAYQHQIMCDKDHQQTKNLLKRSRQSITTLISRFNTLVKEMKNLKRRGGAPPGARVPKALAARDLFRLDVDDDIWVDLAADGDANTIPPAWMSDIAVRISIPALLECDCVKEEREHLQIERKALRSWLKEETLRLHTALETHQDDIGVAYQSKCRLQSLWNTVQHWKQSFDGDVCEASVYQLLDSVMDPVRIFTSTNKVKGRSINNDPEDEVSTFSDSDDSAAVSKEEEEALMELVEYAIARERNLSMVELDDIDKRDDRDSEDGDLPEQSHHGLALQPLMTASKPLLMGFIPQPSSLSATHRVKWGRTCGKFSCQNSHIERLAKGDKWFEGSVISVIAEAMAQAAGENRKAVHITPKVLQSVRQILLNPTANSIVEPETKSVHDNAATEGPVVIPAHVPGHWTLVCLDLGKHIIAFHDSLPNMGDDETNVKEEVLYLLDMVRKDDDNVARLWEWRTEHRPQRQFNGYDCGAFALTDMASYINAGQPSTWDQEMMSA